VRLQVRARKPEGSSGKQNNFPVVSRICAYAVNREYHWGGKNETAVATFRNVACLPALLTLSVVLAACGGGAAGSILPVPLRAAHRSAFPSPLPPATPAQPRYFDSKPERTASATTTFDHVWVTVTKLALIPTAARSSRPEWGAGRSTHPRRKESGISDS
jgi:hypothetical protein